MQLLQTEMKAVETELAVLKDVAPRDRYGSEYAKYYDMRPDEVISEFNKAKRHADTLHAIAVDVRRAKHPYNPNCRCDLTTTCFSCKEFD